MGAQLILASGSPRRRELLITIGVAFTVQVADIDESPFDGEDPVGYVGRIATNKAGAIVQRVQPDDRTCVLAADTTVDLDGTILAKPVDDADARRMLSALSGRTHQVHTSVVGWSSGGTHSVTVTTDVAFAQLSDDGIEWYLSMGEHLDKAGAYGMQGAGAALVRRIEGSPSNVIGLPLAETIAVLRSCGLAVAGG